VDGGRDVTGYEAAGSLQASYLPQARNKELALVWLSPLARFSYRQQAENNPQVAQFRALGIPTTEGDLYQRLAASKGRASVAVPAALRKLVEEYTRTQDVVLLDRARAEGRGLTLERFIDSGTQQAFLLIQGGPGTVPLVANLAPRDPARPETVRRDRPDEEGVRAFVRTRALWFEVGGTR
jgi:hypothetical protein